MINLSEILMEKNLTNIDNYFEKEGFKYGVPLEEFRKVCRTPFLFIKKVMATGKLKNIRLQFFGTFKISQGRYKYFERMNKLKITENEGKDND